MPSLLQYENLKSKFEKKKKVGKPINQSATILPDTVAYPLNTERLLNLKKIMLIQVHAINATKSCSDTSFIA